VLAKLFREIFDQIGSGICWQPPSSFASQHLTSAHAGRLRCPCCGQRARSTSEVSGCRNRNLVAHPLTSEGLRLKNSVMRLAALILRPGANPWRQQSAGEAASLFSRAIRFPVVVSVHLLGTECAANDTSEQAPDDPLLKYVRAGGGGGGGELTCSDAVVLVYWSLLRSSSSYLTGRRRVVRQE
jgi:hypothetical protein